MLTWSEPGTAGYQSIFAYARRRLSQYSFAVFAVFAAQRKFPVDFLW